MSELFEELSHLDIRRDMPMRLFTTFRLGGPADLAVFARNEDEVRLAINAALYHNEPYLVVGNGSNLIVRDGGIRGLVIVIGPAMAEIRQEGTLLTAGAGVSLTALSKEAARRGLMGMDWACGIPGTLGGACAMNAGAYNGEMKQVLRCIRYLEAGVVKEASVREEEFGYRQSPYCAPERIVLSATLALMPDDGGAQARQEEYLCRRKAKQPLEYPSAGSVFKRPPGHFAGALIERAGLKGLAVGDAQISEKHAGFIINRGNATASDVLRLIALVKQRVYETAGVELECEPKIVGEDITNS